MLYPSNDDGICDPVPYNNIYEAEEVLGKLKNFETPHN